MLGSLLLCFLPSTATTITHTDRQGHRQHQADASARGHTGIPKPQEVSSLDFRSLFCREGDRMYGSADRGVFTSPKSPFGPRFLLIWPPLYEQVGNCHLLVRVLGVVAAFMVDKKGCGVIGESNGWEVRKSQSPFCNKQDFVSCLMRLCYFLF